MTATRRPLRRKVLQRDDFGLCVSWPKTHWAVVCGPGDTCEVLIDGKTRRVHVATERCNCRGKGWHEHRFLKLPDAMGAKPAQAVEVAAPGAGDYQPAAEAVVTLSQVIDEVNDSLLFGRALSAARRKRLGRLLADQQGKPGCYHELFVPIGDELAEGYRVLTGEHIRSGGGARHVLGEEALRALVLLQGLDKPAKGRTYVSEAIRRASQAMDELLRKHESSPRGSKGHYCCNRCSVALWKALSVGAIGDCEDRLASGMRGLKERRDGKGDWRGYKFYYTISALVDICSDEAVAELRYALPTMARRLRGAGGRVAEPYAGRRHALLERALSIVE